MTGWGVVGSDDRFRRVAGGHARVRVHVRVHAGRWRVDEETHMQNTCNRFRIFCKHHRLII